MPNLQKKNGMEQFHLSVILIDANIKGFRLFYHLGF
jgi:hypothetical protein